MSRGLVRRSHQPAKSPRASHPSSYVATEDRGVGIDSPITEKWPVAAGFLDQLAITFGDKHLGCRARFREDSPEWIGNEGMTKEFDAVSPRLFLVSNTIRRCDENSIRDRMCALRCPPGINLRLTELSFLSG